MKEEKIFSIELQLIKLKEKFHLFCFIILVYLLDSIEFNSIHWPIFNIHFLSIYILELNELNFSFLSFITRAIRNEERKLKENWFFSLSIFLHFLSLHFSLPRSLHQNNFIFSIKSLLQSFEFHSLFYLFTFNLFSSSQFLRIFFPIFLLQWIFQILRISRFPRIFQFFIIKFWIFLIAIDFISVKFQFSIIVKK